MTAEWITAYAAFGQFLAAVILAGLTGVYVWQNRSIVANVALQAKEQQRAARASLLSQILAEYGSPEMGVAIRDVKEWQVKYGYNFFDTAFQNGLSSATPAEVAAQGVDRDWAKRIDDGSRRRLSQYFSRIRALAENDLIDRKLIAAALGREPVDFFIEAIDPLDQAQRRALGRPRTSGTQEFFQRLRAAFPVEE